MKIIERLKLHAAIENGPPQLHTAWFPCKCGSGKWRAATLGEQNTVETGDTGTVWGFWLVCLNCGNVYGFDFWGPVKSYYRPKTTEDWRKS